MSSTDLSTVTRAFERGPQRYLPVPNGRIAHWSFGRGPDLVCVHGWPLTGATWRSLVPLLASDFTVHVIDLPGTGFTEVDGPVGFEEHGATVRRVVDALGLGPYALLGHDSGGLIARIAAGSDPRVRGIVLGNTEIHGHHSPMVSALAAVARLPGGVAAIGNAMKVGAVRRSRFGFGGCFRDTSLIDGEFGRLFVEPLLNDPAVARRQWRLLIEADFSINDRIDAIHAELRAPVRNIWGTDDPFFPLAKAKRALSSLPAGSDLVEIEGGKLFVHEEYPHEFALHAKSFLGGLDWHTQLAASA
jgi:haloalkane dehalogenase